MTGPLARLVAATAVLTGAIAAAMAAPHNAASNPLRVSMYAADGSVEVIVTNTSRQVARVPKWQLPSSELQANLFRISRDGQPVAYEGIAGQARPAAAFGLRHPASGPELPHDRRPAQRLRHEQAGAVHDHPRLAVAACLPVRRQHAQNRSRAADAAAERAAAGLERRPPQAEPRNPAAGRSPSSTASASPAARRPRSPRAARPSSTRAGTRRTRATTSAPEPLVRATRRGSARIPPPATARPTITSSRSTTRWTRAPAR